MSMIQYVLALYESYYRCSIIIIQLPPHEQELEREDDEVFTVTALSHDSEAMDQPSALIYEVSKRMSPTPRNAASNDAPRHSGA